MNLSSALEENMSKIKVTIVENKTNNINNNFIDTNEKLTHNTDTGEDKSSTKSIILNKFVEKNTNTMEEVFENVTKSNDKVNLGVTSEKICSSCNNKVNPKIPFLNKEKVNKQFIKKEDGVFSFVYSGKEIGLCVFKTLLPSESSFQMLRRAFEIYAPNMESLCIIIRRPDNHELFRNLKCFNNIKTIKVDVLSLKKNGNKIFATCPSLRPINLHIRNLTLKKEDIIDDEKFQFPSQIKNIVFKSGPQCLEWLVNQMTSLEKGHFDSFDITYSAFSRLTDVSKIEFLKIVPYFKKVNYYIDDFISDTIDQYVAKIFAKYKTNLVINIYFSQTAFDKNILGCPNIIEDFDENRGDILCNPSNRFLPQPGIYLNISKLVITDIDDSRRYHPFSTYELEVLTRDISIMRSLEKLEIDLHLFKSFPHFKYFCSGIEGQLKFLKIGKCSTIMSYHLPEISNSCKKLEYLFLEDVGPYTTVTINEVLKHIKHLKGLVIIFNDFYNVKYILNNLRKKVDGKEINVLEQPNIEFLEVHFSSYDHDYREIIMEIDKNTPRERVKLQVKEKIVNKKSYYQITIQRRTTLSNEFKGFNDSYV